MNDFDLRKYLAENKLIKEDISSHKEEAKRFLEKFIDDNEDTFEFIPDLKTGYIDTKDNSYNVDELASIFLDIGQDIPRGKYNKKYKGKGGTYVVVAEGKLLKEDMSPRSIKKYLSIIPPEEYGKYFSNIENFESYSDRDRAIFIYLQESDNGPGVYVTDKVAKAIKGKSGADIIKYFQDEMYEYMPYGEMRKILGVPAVTGFIWDESGSEEAEDWYLDPKVIKKLNKIFRANYPELDVPRFNKRQFDLVYDIENELDDYYRGLAREQRGEDLEVSYEEYAENWVQSLKDRIEQLENSDDVEQKEFALKLK